MKSRSTFNIRAVSWTLAMSALGLLPFAVTAQIAFDGSIGGPAGSLSGPNYQIPHTRGAMAGGNLFHSFSTFNLAQGQSATFSGPATVDNILARVTGGPSSIQGTIRSQIEGANLFLINPAGIVFGRGANVDVSGAFHATTADFVELADGQRFYAGIDGTASLSFAPPVAFGFLAGSVKAGEIRMDPNSTVVSGMNLAGKDVAFVGRRVELRNSFLKSAGGEISLQAVGNGEGRIPLTTPPGEAPADPSLTGEVVVFNSALSVSGADGGEILIRGGNVSVDRAGAALLQSGTQFEVIGGIEADATGSAAGGKVRIEASNNILLGNNARVASFSRNSLQGGTLSFHAGGTMTLATGADVVASAVSQGDGGDIRITGGSLVIDGTGASRPTRLSAQSNSTATGDAGSIQVDMTGLLSLKDGGSIVSNTFSPGAGGNIRISAGSMSASQESDSRYTGVSSSTAVPENPVHASGYGNAGTVVVNVAGLIDLREMATIGSVSSSDGNGGTVQVTAGSLSITGTEPLGRPNEFLTGILGLTTLRVPTLLGSPIQGGRGGDISVNVTGDINLIEGGLIDSSSFGTGKGGNVGVTAGNILADRGGSDFFTGIGSDTELQDVPSAGGLSWNAGDVTVSASSIKLLNGALISSSTAGGGNAGNVTVETGTLHASGSGSASDFVFSTRSGVVAITRGATDGTEASTGDGGTVRVLAGEEIVLGGGAEIAARADGTGAGGTVDVRGGGLVLEKGGRISSSSDLSGDAGRILLNGGSLVMRDGGVLESLSTGSGQAGGIDGVFDAVDLVDATLTTSSALTDAGTLRLSAEGNLTGERVVISANAGNDGGNIRIEAGGLIWFQESQISADAGGSGGNIEFLGARHLVLDDTPVSASAVDRDGGNILISTGTFFANNSPLSVTSERGAPGTVRIETINTLSGAEEAREIGWLDPDDVLQPSCAERRPDAGSSFTRGGRGGAQRLPGGHLPAFRLIQ